MFQKYYDTNIMTNFVKNLVGSTYIPNVPIWKPDTTIIKNNIYITPNYIVRAKDKYVPNNYGGGPRTDLDGNYFDIIDKYIDNTPNHGYCTKYNSPNSYYDPKTHYYLGQYLRMQRDMHNLNLMAYYNCWCGEYSDKLRINGTEITKDNTTSDGLKTLLVPIKYNQQYTIYINTNYPVSIASVCIANNNVIGNILNSANIPATNFFKPYLFTGVDKNATDNNSNELEKYLTLLIQVSVQSSSNIIILEGDYRLNNLISYGEFKDGGFNIKNKLTQVFYDNYDGTNLNYFDYPQLIDNYCKISPELIRNINNINYAFDDRLVEYLLLNVIDNKDTISDNIKRVQTYLLSNNNSSNNKIIKSDTKEKSNKITDFVLSNDNYTHMKGVWDSQLRMYLYDLVTQHWKTPKTIDISGYVDKDVEIIIGDNV